jgi:DDB1- and CUL4-associated factor 7
VHSLDWCKSATPGQQLRPRSAFRLGIASFTENFSNRIAVIGLQDERILVEDDFTDYPDFVTLCETHHGYPATNLQWQPASALGRGWSQNSSTTELLATTGDALRVFEYCNDDPPPVSNYVGRQASTPGGHTLALKTALSGVRVLSSFSLIVALHLWTMPSAIESANTVYGCSTNELLVEREGSRSYRDLIY